MKGTQKAPIAQWLFAGAALLFAVCLVAAMDQRAATGPCLSFAGLFVACMVGAGIVGSRWWFAVLIGIVVGAFALVAFSLRHCCMM